MFFKGLFLQRAPQCQGEQTLFLHFFEILIQKKSRRQKLKKSKNSHLG
jgi:hypothetical protein